MVPCHSRYIYGTWRSKEVGGKVTKDEATIFIGAGGLLYVTLTSLSSIAN